jgi:hypothetical protein
MSQIKPQSLFLVDYFVNSATFGTVKGSYYYTFYRIEQLASTIR